ncbi:unnamed protein product [Chondrus crispus]|uniref:Uncharacterized protein n=1 Tax=Chondrus crispus TaxID=2769 RepID=R7QFY9_CHOCR|nr:unnamed protein product [Chondrus crispus]CDF36683.1 unnamed protein product [Chondrus crispus]|eukprot:XP_005716502.1 unnamed protein product [Chondrus crispus]
MRAGIGTLNCLDNHSEGPSPVSVRELLGRRLHN